MNQYTKGKWKAISYPDKKPELIAGKRVVAEFNSVNDACLALYCVNHCTELNPDNPFAVAESIKDMYEALKRCVQEMNIDEECDHDVGICWCSYKNARFQAKQALSKAEGK